MQRFGTITVNIVRGGAMALVVVASACGYAKRADVDAEFARVRQEQQQGDAALAARADLADARMAALERELQALRSDFDMTIQRLEGMLAFNVPVHFEFDRADVRPQDQVVLDRFAAVVRSYYPTALVTVEGFADPAGSAAYNKRLGQARADAVMSYLTRYADLPATGVRAVSYGSAPERQVVPGARGPGPQGMPNRRVALVIDYSAAGGMTADRPVTMVPAPHR